MDIKDEAMFDSLLENAENAADVKEVVTVAAEIGAKDKDSLDLRYLKMSTKPMQLRRW